MVAARYDVTDVVAARRRTRPPTALFVAGLAVGWVLAAALVVTVVRLDLGVAVAVATGVVGYLVLPVPIVTVVREVWLRRHRERRDELDRRLADDVPALQSWLDERLGSPTALPADLAVSWLLRPEPASVAELLPLTPEAGWRLGGVAVAARHDRVDDRVLLRLAVLPTATLVADGPEPPLPS